MKIVRNPNRWLKKLSRAAALISLVAGTQATMAQDGAFNYGRTPSGSASEVVDSNRQGLGVLFRGGHMAGDTVGRDDSISHISLAPYVNVDNSFLFGDSRLLRSNGGELAWTFGGGYRHYIEDYDFVAGVNSYFDRSELTGAALNQWGAGAEVLAHGWEWRGNIYETFGDTSALVDQRVAPNSAAFAGENITFTRIDTFASSLKGFDTEAGFLLPGEFSERIDLRAFAGGYMYQGDAIERFGGWSSRLQADIGRWLELGLKVTDDKMFDTTVMFSAAVHFGGFESEEHTRRSAIQRFREPVRRNMHVVATIADVAVGGQIAINPNTGLPFTVAHVNSNDVVGPFSGTVEDPFNLLTAGLAANKDITFVHAGSSFDTLPQNIVSLLTGDILIGEGTINSGRDVMTNVQIEALGRTLNLLLPDSPTFAANPTLLRPTLQDSAGNAVTLASNTRFSGFIIDGATEHGIFADGVENVFISDTLVRNSIRSAVRLDNTIGSVTINDTTLEAINSGDPILHIVGGTGDIAFLSTDTFALAAIRNTSTSHSLLIEDRIGGQINMTGSSITETGGQGILIQNNTGGSAIIDNVSLADTQARGISLLNNDGQYRFRTTNSSETLIQWSQGFVGGGEGIFVDDLRGSVDFQGAVQVINRNAEGFEITNSSGTATFSSSLTIDGIQAGNTAAGVFVHNQLAGSFVGIDSVTIRGTGTNPGSLGNGILLTDNLAGSAFEVENSTSVDRMTLESIEISNNAGGVSFLGSTTITNRLVEGVSITTSSGPIQFGNGPNDVLTISNALDSQSAAFLAVNNDSNVSVSSAVIQNAQGNAPGGAGAHFVTNRGSITFGNLDITSQDGVALFGLDNHRLVSARGDLIADNAAAVNIENSGINLQFDAVSSTDSPDYGIRLVDTNKIETAENQNVRTFVVDPSRLNANIIAGNGGTISGAKGDGLLNNDAAGIYLVNAGRVTLRGMSLEDNEIGILVDNSNSALSIARATIDRPDLPQNQRQQLVLNRTDIEDSDIRGIDALDLVRLEILNGSRFTGNGDDDVEGRESIRLHYNKLINSADGTQILLSRVTDPYVVVLEDSFFDSDTTDILRITHGSNLGESALSLNVFNSRFTLTDASDPTNDVSRLFDDAIIVDWDGILETRFEEGNVFSLQSASQQQAIIINNGSNTDQSLLSLQSNSFTVRNGRDNLGLFDYTVDGPMIANQSDGVYQVANNIFQIGAVQNQTTDPIAMRFNLEANAGISFQNNRIEFGEEGGTAIQIADVSDPARFRFDGNIMRLFVTQTGQSANGIVFGSTSGVITFQGNVNNEVTDQSGTIALFGRDFVFGGLSTGQTLVNGVLVP